MYLMAKDIPVLKIDKGRCRVLEKELLPFSLRKDRVALEDFYGMWISNRAMELSRTNGKMILNSLRVSQTNDFRICMACHGLSLSDMYWLWEEEEELTWDEVNLFQNDISKGMASTALVGDVLHEHGKIHTPELTTQGQAAKAWVRRDGNLYLYKIGKKELAASVILDALGFSHVPYRKVEGGELEEVVSPERKQRILDWDERVVKCRLIASQEYSMVNFEDFQMYCQYEGKNVYEEVLRLDRRHYLEMQTADYILNNIDRHGANWGFFMDNATGRLTGLYPLLDHDQAFSDVEGMLSQTTEERFDLETAALLAETELHSELEAVLRLDCPEGIGEKRWNQVKERTRRLRERLASAYKGQYASAL